MTIKLAINTITVDAMDLAARRGRSGGSSGSLTALLWGLGLLAALLVVLYLIRRNRNGS